MNINRGIILLFFVMTGEGCMPQVAQTPVQEYSYAQSFGTEICQVAVRVASTSITFADDVDFKLTVTTPEGRKPVMPSLTNLPSGLMVLSSDFFDTRLVGGGTVEHVFSYALEASAGGIHTIPALTIACDEIDENVTVTTADIDIEVRSLLPKDSKAQDIKDVLPPEYIVEGRWGWIALCIVTLLVVVYLVIRWFSRRNKKEVLTLLSAYEKATSMLQELETEQLIKEQRYNYLYTELSSILRHFLEGQFGYRAPLQTTEEFLHSLKSHPELSDEQKKELQQFLRDCDLVKFANHLPQDSDAMRASQSCSNFIENAYRMWSKTQEEQQIIP